MLGLFLKRELLPARQPVAAQNKPVFISGWQRMMQSGILLGDTQAPVKLFEFMDFECPFCRKSDSITAAIRSAFGSRVALVFVHFPGPGHRFALPAARAAECGHAQQRFEELRSLLLRKQDSLGLKSWLSFATEAGVRDSVQFKRCVSTASRPERIAAGAALGRQIGARGTPTFVVNGWRFPVPPTYAELHLAISTILDGKPLSSSADSVVLGPN